MSWPATTFALLAVVLVGGLAWYERSRPPARMVALVAALAALAVAGRLAFAAIPNVVATTDIVLFTGFALGPAPGFAVGALAALVSNMWLGQGPWTPWEMAGWGLVGVGGAALGVLTARRLGRGGLAVACGVAGLAYGALLDLSVMVTYGGEQSLDRYLALSARGIPFNVAHAMGNVVLALAAGPALVRLIMRYRSRFEFRWRPAPAAGARVGVGPLAVLLVVGGAALVCAPARAAPGAWPTFGSHANTKAGHAGGAARGWLKRAQNADGGFGASVGDGSSPAMTGWAVLGLEGAGLNPLDLRSDEGRTPISYLRAQVDRVHSTGDLERTVLAAAGAGVSPHSFGGRDLVTELRARRDRDGSFDGQVNLTAFGVLALRAAGADSGALGHSVGWLRRKRNGDGGWGFQPGAPSDADSTGAALQGLAAADAPRAALGRGASYLRHVQDRDGGFALSGSGSSNSQSTAWAVQGLAAAGVDPAGVRSHGRSPLDYLAKRQAGDGHYAYSTTSDQTPVWVTAQALLAVERRALPIAPVARSTRPGPAPTKQESAGPTQPGPGAPPYADGGGALPARAASPHHGSRPPNGPSAQPPGGGPPTGLAAADDGLPRPDPETLPPPSAGGAGDTGRYVVGGLVLLAALLVGGFFVYRRTLP